jgi:riboflavin synthase
MFTGIVEQVGEVVSVEAPRLSVGVPVAWTDIAVGDSIAVSGVCLTATEVDPQRLSFDVSEETLARTDLGSLRAGDPVNLERAATLVSRLGGHLVQGHVDAVADVVEVRPEGEGGVRLSVRVPQELLRYVVEKGSIAFDGVSLTVAALDGAVVGVSLIPHTLAATTLGSVDVGDRINLEVDVVAKYVARQAERSVDGRVGREERTAWTRG